MPKKPALIYQIKVTLDDTRPPIWRRILVPGNTSLLKLHDILQIIMGWQDYHLHCFLINDQYYGDPEDDESGDMGTIDEKRVKLDQIIPGEGFRFKYEYDFGDSWEHTLDVEKILPVEEGVKYPVCVKGKRACPPEDVGGIWGYENFLEAIRDPNHEEHDEYLEWSGGGFDPETFDLEQVNRRLQTMGKGQSANRDNTWAIDEEVLAQNKLPSNTSQFQSTSPDHVAVAEALPMRRDALTLLSYLRTRHPAGTQSTGNLPLKAVREIAAGFVRPPILEEKVGDQVFRVHSETEVWPLYFLHILVTVGNLAEGGPGRRWKLTPLGEQFLEATPFDQVWHLFNTWMTKINWEIATPYWSVEWTYTPRFARLVLDMLLALPGNTATPFETFADALIDRASPNLTWPASDQANARMALHNIIRSVVVNPLSNFGVLEIEQAPSKETGPSAYALRAFQVTPFGSALLAAIAKEMAE